MVHKIAPHVAILLCTRNGAAFLGGQLQSFADQTHKNWSVIASDDASTDATHALLAGFAAQSSQNVIVREGPGHGACANFVSLAVDPGIEADCFAYSDQDDIWRADKLERALAWLGGVSPDVPALYCSRTELIRTDDQSYGLSPLFGRPPGFRNALVQNIGGGNTMVFNRAAKKLLEAAGPREVVAHDWWTYQLVAASNGAIRYDPHPTIKYRQHANNLVGSNIGWSARVVRMRMLMRGRFARWNDRNISALRSVPPWLIKPDNRRVLDEFAMARSGPVFSRLFHLRRSDVYRQTFLGNMGLVAAAILNRL